MEQRLRSSPEKFLGLIEFMERNGDLSRPQVGAQGRLRGERLWLQLTGLLNSIGGGAQKSRHKWKKVWADWKTKKKKKYLLLRQHASGTGGGPSSRHNLTALEERVLAIIGVSAVIGQPGIQEQGFNAPTPLNATTSERSEESFVIEIPHINASPIPSPLEPSACTPPPPPVVATQPSTPPRPSPPPPLRRTPPNNTGRPASVSPRSTTTTPRRRLHLRARRTRGLTPFDRAASEFVAVEHRRLQLEEDRERRLHERELERLRLEAQRIQVAQEHNQLLQQLYGIAQNLLEMLPQQRPNSLPSTDILPNQE